VRRLQHCLLVQLILGEHQAKLTWVVWLVRLVQLVQVQGQQEAAGGSRRQQEAAGGSRRQEEAAGGRIA
jgi:hypothetical protein